MLLRCAPQMPSEPLILTLHTPRYHLRKKQQRIRETEPLPPHSEHYLREIFQLTKRSQFNHGRLNSNLFITTQRTGACKEEQIRHKPHLLSIWVIARGPLFLRQLCLSPREANLILAALLLWFYGTWRAFICPSKSCPSSVLITALLQEVSLSPTSLIGYPFKYSFFYLHVHLWSPDQMLLCIRHSGIQICLRHKVFAMRKNAPKVLRHIDNERLD